MPAILKIGYNIYLVKSEAAAVAALKALSDAVPVESDYVGKLGEVYYPAPEDRHRAIELKIISVRQLVRSKPGEEPEEPREVKRLGYDGKVHYHPDSPKPGS